MGTKVSEKRTAFIFNAENQQTEKPGGYLVAGW
jgi:hypothetical protein